MYAAPNRAESESGAGGGAARTGQYGRPARPLISGTLAEGSPSKPVYWPNASSGEGTTTADAEIRGLPYPPP